MRPMCLFFGKHSAQLAGKKNIGVIDNGMSGDNNMTSILAMGRTALEVSTASMKKNYEQNGGAVTTHYLYL